MKKWKHTIDTLSSVPPPHSIFSTTACMSIQHALWFVWERTPFQQFCQGLRTWDVVREIECLWFIGSKYVSETWRVLGKLMWAPRKTNIYIYKWITNLFVIYLGGPPWQVYWAFPGYHQCLIGGVSILVSHCLPLGSSYPPVLVAPWSSCPSKLKYLSGALTSSVYWGFRSIFIMLVDEEQEVWGWQEGKVVKGKCANLSRNQSIFVIGCAALSTTLN